MNKIKEIIDNISEKDELKDKIITSFIKELEEEKYGVEQNNKYLVNKMNKLFDKYGKNIKN